LRNLIIAGVASVAIITTLVILFTGLPFDSEDKVNEVKSKFSKSSLNLKKLVTVYDKELKKHSSDITKMANQNFKGDFDIINNKKDKITLIIKRLDQFLDENKKDSLEQFNGALSTSFVNIRDMDGKIKILNSRFSKFIQIVLNSKKYNKDALEKIKFLDKTIKIHTSVVQNLLKKYPEKKKRLESSLQSLSDNLMALDNIKSKLNEYFTSNMYFKMMSTIEELALFEKNLNNLVAKKIKPLDALNNSYSVILMDMREDYFVTVARSSWDEYSDWDTEKTYTYKPKRITAEIYNKIASSEGAIASGNLRNIRKTSVWNLLPNINVKENIGRGQTHAEFWINDLTIKYYHKYIILNKNSKKETAWKEVSAEKYEKHYGDLGMEIYSKPYGSFEDEAITTATPIGLNYVGNQRYGEWRTDSSGHSFWHYYGQYAMLSHLMGLSGYGNNRYYRSDYNNYRNYSSSHRPYYGVNNRYGTYSKGTMNSSHFKNSRFARANRNLATKIKSGAKNIKRRVSSTVRGAGGRSRGRGASGGGK